MKSTNSLPKMAVVKAHPDEWKDLKRMKFLMTDFRARDANPEGYDDKMSFWIKNLLKWSNQAQTTEFSVKSIRESFEKDGHTPSVGLLNTVIGSMMANNQIVRLEVYKEMLTKSMAEGWVSWGVSLATKPISWGLSTLIGSSPLAASPLPNVDQDEVLINPESIDSLANKLFIKYRDSSSSVMKYETLQDQVMKDEKMSSSLFELLVLKLQSESKVAVTEDCNFKLIKFGFKCTFSQSEIGLIRLESAKELVESDIRMIETSLEQLKNEARNSIKEGNKMKAKQILKKKKRLEVQMSKREAQLDNIEFLLEQLNESESHPTILTAMKAAADVLRGAEAKHDEILSTLNEVEDVVHVHQDMVADISRSIFDKSTNELELEDELNELLNDEKREEVLSGGKVGTQTEKSDQELRASGKENEPTKCSSVEQKETNHPSSAISKDENQDQELQDLMDRLERLRSGTTFDPLPDFGGEEKGSSSKVASQKADRKEEAKMKEKVAL